MFSYKDCCEIAAIEWASYDVISFDLFDTIIHRTTTNPDYVFRLLGGKAKELGLISECLDVIEFENMRMVMAQNARGKREIEFGDREVTINEIWNEGPEYFDCEKLCALELETECSCTFLNPYIFSLIDELLKQNKKIIIISDTYYDKFQISKILESCGFPFLDRIDIYPSCQYRINKHSGGMYSYIKGVVDTSVNSLIHVGDNFDADYVSAKKQGVKAIHLNSLNTPLKYFENAALLGYSGFNNPFLSMANVLNMSGKMDEPFFRLGATLVSNLLSAFSIFILKHSKSRTINKIHPITREGFFIRQVMNKIAPFIFPDATITECYASRRSTMLASMQGLDVEAINVLKCIRNYSIDNFVQHWGLEDYKFLLDAAGVSSFTDLLSTDAFGCLVKDDDFISATKKKCNDERDILVKYLNQMSAGEDSYSFVDLGPAGNTCKYMQKALKLNGFNTLNKPCFFLYSSSSMAKNRLPGSEYFSFFNNSPINDDKIRTIVRSPEILEVLLTGLFDTVEGYINENGDIRPVTRSYVKSIDQKINLSKFHNGLMFGVDLFVHVLSSVDSSIFISNDAKDILLFELYRLIEMPDYDEAVCLGGLIYDDNGGSSEVDYICNPSDLAAINGIGPDKFISYTRRVRSYRASNIRWPQGAVTQIEPLIIYNGYLSVYDDNENMFFADYLLSLAKLAENKKFAVFGAGDIGEKLLRKSARWGVYISCVIDSRQDMIGQSLCGKEIVSLDDAISNGVNDFIIASLAFSREIESVIILRYESIHRSPGLIISANISFG